MWHCLPEQQQRGVQLDKRVAKIAPDDAVKDRAAQDHEHAGGEPEPGLYPTEPIERRQGDNTPSAARPRADWDERVQPERVDEQGD